MIFTLCFTGAALFAEETPDCIEPLMDAVYAGEADLEAVKLIADEAEARARRELGGHTLSRVLSAREYFLGRAYRNAGNADEAEACFQRGLDFADSAIKEEPSADAYRWLAENISQLCTLKPTAWVIANGTKVEANAKRGLRYDKRNAACRYLISARWVYAPAPFNNTNRGIREMKEILSGDYDLQKDDYFNVYYAIAYAYNRIKQPDKIDEWLDKALAVYPANRDALDLKRGRAYIPGDAE